MTDYTDEIAVIDEILYGIRNNISYCVTVRSLASALSLNRRRLLYENIKALLNVAEAVTEDDEH